ncbi:MAG: C-GCAxxG-C-C family protein [Bacillota bacterium]|nr:C-GCAxxG-C-C family protein [Bacillota bacterium]
MDRKNIAKKNYLGRFNCAQSVVLSFKDEIGLSDDYLEKISLGFGGGIGNLQKTCGALTGGVIVLSVLDKDNIKNLIKKLFEEFEIRNGYLECLNLINIDFVDTSYVLTEEENIIKQEKCLGYVLDVVEILEMLLVNTK